MEIKQEFFEENNCQIEEFRFNECNIKNEVLDNEILVSKETEIKQECSSINLIEIKPEPLLLSQVEFQKDQETYREDNFLKRECGKNVVSRNKYKHSKKIFKRNDMNECPVCQKYFTSVKSKMKHFDGHFKKYFVTCAFCGKNCNGKFQFWNHHVVHWVKNKYKNSCTKSAARKPFAVSLKLKIHTKKTYECEICLKQFTWLSQLKIHFKIHTGEKSFKCEFCFKKFTDRSSLNKHVNIHTGEKSFKCEICLKQFTRSSDLKRHLNIHTREKSFKCEICFKQFSRNDYLTFHLKIHTGDKSYKCEICFKQFTRKDHLDIHFKIHTGEKSYICEICLKQFSQRSNLITHLKIHNGKKIYKCEICPKQFTQKCGINKHLKLHIHTNQKFL